MNCLTSIGPFVALLCILPRLYAEDDLTSPRPSTNRSAIATAGAADDDEVKDVLSDGEWRRIAPPVDRGLKFLASQHRQDGSFPSYDNAQPAVTSLCLLAFMAHGHTPGHGIYGE